MKKRFQIISIPNKENAFWFVFDNDKQKSYECDSMQSAAETAKLSNKAGHLV